LNCSVSTRKNVVQLVFAILALGLFAFFLSTPNPLPPTHPRFYSSKIGSWLAIVVAGWFAVSRTRDLLRVEPVVVVDDVGILDRRHSATAILWSDIARVTRHVEKRSSWLEVEFRDPKYSGPRSDDSYLDSLSLFFDTLSPGIDEVWNYLRELRPEKVRAEIVDET